MQVFIGARTSAAAKLREVLNRQLELDFLVRFHEEVFDTTRRQDSVFSEGFSRFVEVDVEAWRVQVLDLVVFEVNVVTGLLPLKKSS